LGFVAKAEHKNIFSAPDEKSFSASNKLFTPPPAHSAIEVFFAIFFINLFSMILSKIEAITSSKIISSAKLCS
tara:strand:+ start:646 stop:864 length:219 start_codon:yes stop_codon:yes gene_type:complete